MAFVTVHLALRRFRSEKWWVRTHQTYLDIFEAIQRNKMAFEDRAALQEHHSHYSDADHYSGELRKYGEIENRARETVERFIGLARFQLSAESADILEGYRKELGRLTRPPEECWTHAQLLDHLFMALRASAFRELRNAPKKRSSFWIQDQSRTSSE